MSYASTDRRWHGPCVESDHAECSVWHGLAKDLEQKGQTMKTLKALLVRSAVGLCLLGGRSLMAQVTTTTPPVVVPPDRDDRDLIRDLKNAPAPVKQLILSFDATRDKFLAEQAELRRKLKGATEEQREKIREQLQDNRAAFLAELKTFRQDLRKDLQSLKGEISHQEFRRILDAARDAARERHG